LEIEALVGCGFVDDHGVFAISLLRGTTLEHGSVHHYIFIVDLWFGVFDARFVLLVDRNSTTLHGCVSTDDMGWQKCYHGVFVGRKWVSTIFVQCVLHQQ
jgi:hypothetical protein